MRKLFLLMIMLAASVAIGQVVRSSIGARSISYGNENEEYANPYVIRGLVAMWDGEWNAGLGIHDEAPSIWLDCISGQALIFGTDVGVRGNSFENLTKDDTSKDMPAFLNMGDSEFAYHLMSTGDFTIEICEDATSVQEYYVWRSPLIRLTNKDSSTSYGSAIFVQQYYNRFLGRGIFGDIALSKAFDLHTFAFCVNYSDLESSVYKNGARARVESIPEITAFTAIPLRVGITNKMYCIRIYDRVLSADEVRHNYLIDKRRFDLP